MLATLQWLDATPEHYITNSNVAGARLRPASEGHVRVDMRAVVEANGDPRGANGRSRTTIQTLAAAATRSDQPIASLTRLTEF